MATNTFLYLKTAAPSSSSDDSVAGYSVGDHWDDTTNDKIYEAIDVSAGAAVWIEKVGVTQTQTLTNKTLTTPVINSATGVGTSRYIIKSANETVNNSATLQNDNDFSFAIAANEKWLVEMFLAVTSVSVNSDFKFNFTLPASCTIRFGTGSNSAILGWGAGATTVSPLGLSTSADIAAGSFNGTWGLLVVATIVNSSTAGTVQYQWAQNTLTAEDTILLANSVMRYTRLA